MNVLELKGISYIYGKGTPFQKVALDNVNVSFEKGKITGLIGHTAYKAGAVVASSTSNLPLFSRT